jgi:predicted GTPase
MSLWQPVVLLILLALPVAGLGAAGAYLLWERGWFFWAWLPLPLCWGLAFLLARVWKVNYGLKPAEGPLRDHWTDRDAQVWNGFVAGRIAKAREIDPAEFARPDVYQKAVREMADEIARFYHPKTSDPFGSLTVPEIVACAQLISEDMAEMVDRYVPAGHLLTIDRWRTVAKFPDWYDKGAKLYYAVWAFFNPVGAITRYAASQIGMAPAMNELKGNVVGWFYSEFIKRTGAYLIELNSGRLRVGARRWRELTGGRAGPPSEELAPVPAAVSPAPGTAAPTAAAPKAEPAAGGKPSPSADGPKTDGETDGQGGLTVAVVGQVKAGKSSLINALVGRQAAAVDVTPLPHGVTRHSFRPAEGWDTLTMLDTHGYADAGSAADRLPETFEAVQGADLTLLVMDALNAARDPDARFLESMDAWFAARPHLKRPAVLGVLTHVDGLSPAMEWSPPYDGWADESPARPKERSIREAVGYVRETLGPRVAGVVPCCPSPEAGGGSAWGVSEAVVPSLAGLLPRARGVSLVRTLHAEADAGRVGRLFGQLTNAFSRLASAAFGGRPS